MYFVGSYVKHFQDNILKVMTEPPPRIYESLRPHSAIPPSSQPIPPSITFFDLAPQVAFRRWQM